MRRRRSWVLMEGKRRVGLNENPEEEGYNSIRAISDLEKVQVHTN